MLNLEKRWGEKVTTHNPCLVLATKPLFLNDGLMFFKFCCMTISACLPSCFVVVLLLDSLIYLIRILFVMIKENSEDITRTKK